jgi:hypothetical protein
MKEMIDYSKYKCPYSHIEKECGHELHGINTSSVWCACGFKGPVFCLDPDELRLEKKDKDSKQEGKEYIPIPGKCVLAIVEHWKTKNRRYAVLYASDEDDCNYRTADDNSELSYDWSVVSWDYLPEL